MPRDPDRVCGAKTSHGPCQQWAGANTPHKGIGACSKHGGSTPNGIKAAETRMVEERARTFGEPIDTDPKTALLNEVKRSAGICAWLQEQIAVLERGDITQWTKAFGA